MLVLLIHIWSFGKSDNRLLRVVVLKTTTATRMCPGELGSPNATRIANAPVSVTRFPEETT